LVKCLYVGGAVERIELSSFKPFHRIKGIEPAALNIDHISSTTYKHFVKTPYHANRIGTASTT